MLGRSWPGPAREGRNRYWPALILAPLAVGLIGVVIERALLRRISALDPLYGLLLTFGLALILQGLFRNWFGSWHAVRDAVQLLGGQALGSVPAQLSRLGDRGLARALPRPGP